MKRISAIVAIAIYIGVGLAISWAILVSLTMLLTVYFL